MLHYVYGQHEIVTRFVAQLIPHVDRGFPTDTQSIGVTDDSGRLIAGILYYFHNRRNGTIEMAMAALPKCGYLTRETLRRIFDYPFKQRGCQMVIARVHADDERTLAQLARFGFKFVAMDRLYGRDRDGVICTLTDDEWAAHPVARAELKEAA